MDKILVNARFRIHAGKLVEFKDCAARLIAAVEAREPGALQYLWYFDDAGRECEVREVYRDSEAVLAHADNCGALIGEITRTADLVLDVFGPVSARLREVATSFGAAIWPCHGGLDRL